MSRATHRNGPLISAAELAQRLADPALVTVDCRHDLARPAWGELAFRSGHIPGAAFAHLDRDLSAPVTPASGRHPLPERTVLAAFFGSLGIGPDTRVVAYDQGRAAYAARLWWLLRWLGHEQASVLDGGLAAWQAEGRPLTEELTARASRTFVISSPLVEAIDTAAVQKALTDPAAVLFDARGADRFAGENETIDPVAGHVPGARNFPFLRNFDAAGRLLPPAQLRALWHAALERRPPGQAIAMCGSGVTACQNLLALEVAGLHGARLYGGSWSEWIRDPARPVARGPA